MRQHPESRVHQAVYRYAGKVLNYHKFASHLPQNRILGGGAPYKIRKIIFVTDESLLKSTRISKGSEFINDVHEYSLSGVCLKEGPDYHNN